MSRHSKRPSACRERKLEELKDFGLTLFLSGATGALVALPFYVFYRAPLLLGAAEGAFAGMLIGLVSRTGFVFIQRRVGTRPVLAFAFTFFAIGVGTFAGAFLLGLRGVLPFILLVAAAETAGLTVTFLKYRYSLKLNEKLQAFQRRIQVESEKR